MTTSKKPRAMTLADVQAQHGLMEMIWKTAVDEAYSSKDAERRMNALVGLPQAEVIEAYFAEHPAMKRWADQHIEAGTCDEAINELSSELERVREMRKEARAARQNLQEELRGTVALSPVFFRTAPSSSPVEQASSHSGAPGRPTSKHLVVEEFKRRAAASQDLPSLTVISRDLSSWLHTIHPSLAQMKPRSVENAIRDEYRRATQQCTK